MTLICTITFIYFFNISKHNNSFEELKTNIILTFGDLKNMHNSLQKVHLLQIYFKEQSCIYNNMVNISSTR